MFILFFTFFLFNHKIVSNYDLTPSHGFVDGNCHYWLSVNGSEPDRNACFVFCGEDQGFAPDQFCQNSDLLRHQVYCAPFDPSIITEPNGFGQITLRIGFCDQLGRDCQNSTEFENEITIYKTPRFNSTRFSIYDSIEHDFNLQGQLFNAFYSPKLIVRFTRSHLPIGIRGNCTYEIDCTIIDENNLNCIKPEARNDCLPQSPEEFGSWYDTSVLFRSHGYHQPIYSFIAHVHQLPTFDSVTWDSRQVKFIINLTGHILLKAQASCVVIDEDDETVYSSLVYTSDGIVAFELDHLLLANKTLNCTLIMDDRMVYPLGLVTLREREPEPEQKPIDYLTVTILIVITCSLLILTLVVAFVVIKSQKNHELRLKSATDFKSNGK